MPVAMATVPASAADTIFPVETSVSITITAHRQSTRRADSIRPVLAAATRVLAETSLLIAEPLLPYVAASGVQVSVAATAAPMEPSPFGAERSTRRAASMVPASAAATAATRPPPKAAPSPLPAARSPPLAAKKPPASVAATREPATVLTFRGGPLPQTAERTPAQ